MKDSIRDIIHTHRSLLTEFENNGIAKLLQISELLCKCIKNQGCIYICGNGGSAADAQHIAGELVGRFQKNRKAFAAAALTTDTSVITAIANDFSYEDIFARQVEALASEKDILWAFSTSGTSPNIIKAAQAAKKMGVSIISFTGKPASKLEQISDLCLCIASTSTARCQEIHQLAYHILCELIEQNCS